MWLLDLFLPPDNPEPAQEHTSPDDTELDPKLLFEMAEYWVKDTAQNDGPLTEFKREAIKYTEKVSRGGFLDWLRGK